MSVIGKVCKCGDWKDQHENGQGRCLMTDSISHGSKPCLKYRFSHHEEQLNYSEFKKLKKSVGFKVTKK